MKPRIAPYMPKSFAFSGCKWKCSGEGRMGIGETPAEAYWAWRWFINQRGSVA